MPNPELAADVIIMCGAVIAALSVIAGLLIKVIMIGRKIAAENDYANYCRLWTLRQAIVNPRFPDVERLDAYKTYKEHGGNGYMAEYAEELRARMSDKIAGKIDQEV